MQSRYYDPELGRFLNADAYASTGQGILGNNMFAYCGNNPANYADPSGNQFAPTGSHIKATHFLAPGLRGTALAQYLQGANSYGDLPGEQILKAVGYFSETGLSVLCSIIYPLSKPVTFFVDALAVYDECRFSGLGAGSSIVASVVCALITNKPISFTKGDEGFFSEFSLNIASDLFKNWIIVTFTPSSNEAEQNRIQHISQKAGFVAVSGWLRYTFFTNDWGDGISVRP